MPTALMNLVTAYGGFVASTQTQTASPGSPAQSTVTLQVPEASFDQVLNAVKGYGKVASLTTQATDVTGQYVDLQAQITALQDSRQQYLTIMTKATTIGGILSVQSQLDTLQSQLDQLQGQLRLLNNETTYATLAVTVTQKVVAPPPPRPQSGLDKAWHGAVNGFVAGGEGVVALGRPHTVRLVARGRAVRHRTDGGPGGSGGAGTPPPARRPDAGAIAGCLRGPGLYDVGAGGAPQRESPARSGSRPPSASRRPRPARGRGHRRLPRWLRSAKRPYGQWRRERRPVPLFDNGTERR